VHVGVVAHDGPSSARVVIPPANVGGASGDGLRCAEASDLPRISSDRLSGSYSRFSSISYASTSRSRRSSQVVTVSSNMWKVETSITCGSLHHTPQFAIANGVGRDVGHYA
jgi:hypothetical protein